MRRRRAPLLPVTTADHAARIKVPTTANTRRCDVYIVGQWQCLYNDDGNDRVVAVSVLAAGVRQLYSAMILTVSAALPST
jgi:hypothetical protein